MNVQYTNPETNSPPLWGGETIAPHFHSGWEYTIATPHAPGAIGIIQLHGPDVVGLLKELTGREIPPHRSTLVKFAGIDEGLVALLRPDFAQIMPHGGVRVMQRLAERLRECGAVPSVNPNACDLYPEAACPLEAEMLLAIAQAASPAAIDLLLHQPKAWRQMLTDATSDAAIVLPRGEADPRRHLIHPPSVVLVGQPNVGKSTLSNYIHGRQVSITADMPGTTRDWVAGLGTLSIDLGEWVVRWCDTPGLRQSDDPIEQKAIEVVQHVIESADVLIAMCDPQTDWPVLTSRRKPDVWVMNKADLLDDASRSALPPTTLCISATSGGGVEALSQSIARTLQLVAGEADGPWAFSPAVQGVLDAGDRKALEQFCGLG